MWEFFFFTYQWAVSGKTLGMAVFGLQVVTKEGGPIKTGQAVRRTIGLAVTLFLTFGIGFLGIVFQRERAGLDDFIAGTAVVYDWDARAARLRWIARKEGPHPQGQQWSGGVDGPSFETFRRLPTMPPMSFTEITRPHPFVAVVTLNRPERMNAMAFDVMIPFRDALATLATTTTSESSSLPAQGGDSARGQIMRTPGRCRTSKA